MNLVIFGLSVSSTWGNGHAALWRGLIAALRAAGHGVSFFERDVPYYAQNRDLTDLNNGARLVLYPDWNAVLPAARRALAEADAAIITSYCADARDAARLVLDSAVPVRCFYDLDTPVTLGRRRRGEDVAYLPKQGLGGFDLVLSYTGGGALEALRRECGARRVAPLYGSVDPGSHRQLPRARDCAALSYLGTYADDRQAALVRLFVEPARQRPALRFLLAGAQYPDDFPWTRNMYFLRHLPPDAHPRFYADSRLTLNVTRADMAAMGWCPSGRLFEAAACGAPLLSDTWPGLDEFFTPGSEILIAHDTEEALRAIDLPDATLRAVAARARARVLDTATAAHRARELVAALEGAGQELA